VRASARLHSKCSCGQNGQASSRDADLIWAFLFLTSPTYQVLWSVSCSGSPFMLSSFGVVLG